MERNREIAKKLGVFREILAEANELLVRAGDQRPQWPPSTFVCPGRDTSAIRKGLANSGLRLPGR